MKIGTKKMGVWMLLIADIARMIDSTLLELV